MSIEFFIARRMQLTTASGRSSSTGVVIAVAGIALALVVMLVSVSVVLGFKHQIREKVMGFDAQLTVVAQKAYGSDSIDGTVVKMTPHLRSLIQSVLPEGAKMSLVSRRPGILKTDSAFAGIVVKGLEPGNDSPFIRSNVVAGVMPDYAADSTLYHVVISSTVASRLGLESGDRVNAYFFSGAVPRARRLTVAGLYDTHFGEYDALYAFGSLEMLQRLNSEGADCGSAIEISGLPDDATIDRVGRELADALLQGLYSGCIDTLYAVENVHDTAALYFNWLALLDTNVVVILILMALVSGFTLVSSLFIIILERVGMIGTLKALGAGNRMIERTFIIVAERLVGRGLIIGNIVGLGIVLIQRAWHLLPLDPEAYYLDYVPVEINWWWVVGLNVAVVVIAALVLILPSRIIATLSPASSMRYE
mgnify:CR=1 FL=1